MAKTRTQIKTAVDNNTGRGTEKATLIETLCDDALKIAGEAHPFKDASSFDQDFTITTSATSVDLSSALSNIQHVVTAVIVETSGDRNWPLIMKDETWWQENVINASDNQQGKPEFGLRRGTSVLLNRPCDAGYSLRVTVTTEQTFTNDATVCPIAVADIFVEQYVTAMLFMSIQDERSFTRWYALAFGTDYARSGRIGGTLARIIEVDKRDRVDKMVSTGPPHAGAVGGDGIAVRNLDTNHEDYNNVRLWANGSY
jgi:hypothetical protein